MQFCEWGGISRGSSLTHVMVANKRGNPKRERARLNDRREIKCSCSLDAKSWPRELIVNINIHKMHPVGARRGRNFFALEPAGDAGCNGLGGIGEDVLHFPVG